MRRWILFWGAILLTAALACAEKPETQQAETPTEQPIETIVVSLTTEPEATPEATPEPTEAPTEEPTEAPTETPTATPFATRAPKDGDVTDHFPTEDTGKDADYSYQSDELRIAIKVDDNRESKQVIYVADIWIRNIASFRTAFGHSKFNSGTEEGEDLARRENAIFAVNGSYNIGLTVHDGKKYKGQIKAAKWNNSGVCALYKDGTLRAVDLMTQSFNADTELKKGLLHAWQFGPALVHDGKIVERKYDNTRHPRNMIGYYEPGHYVIVTCDGRGDYAIGMTIEEMKAYMHGLGVKEAFNLDGGYSAVMVFMGTVINNPAFTDHNGTAVQGRPLKDMVLFSEYDASGAIRVLSDLKADKLKKTN